MENIVYALRANLEQAERVSGLRAKRIALGGGLTRAPVLQRILADVLERPIEAAAQEEVSARGAAILAARAVGVVDKSLRAPMERVDPEPAAVETYQRQYERWRCMGETLDRTEQDLP